MRIVDLVQGDPGLVVDGYLPGGTDRDEHRAEFLRDRGIRCGQLRLVLRRVTPCPGQVEDRLRIGLMDRRVDTARVLEEYRRIIDLRDAVLARNRAERALLLQDHI